MRLYYAYYMKKILLFLAKYFYSILASLYFFTLGILSGRERKYLADFAAHFGFDTRKKVPHTAIPQIDPNELMRVSSPLIIREPEAVSGNVSLLELTLINSFIQQLKPRTIFEIGTFDGRTTLNMAANISEGAVYTLDLPYEESIETKFAITGDKKFMPNAKRKLRFEGTPEEKKINRLFGDSANFNFFPFKNTIDLLFIDGAHTCEYVVNDTKKTESIVREKSIVLWHDYGTWEGVTRALNELYKNNPRYKNLKHIRGTSLAYLYLL